MCVHVKRHTCNKIHPPRAMAKMATATLSTKVASATEVVLEERPEAEAGGVAAFKPAWQLPVVPGPFGLEGMRRKGTAEKRRLRTIADVAEQARLAVNAMADPTQVF